MADTEASFEKRLGSKTTDLETGKTYLVGVAVFRSAVSPDASDPYELLVVKRASHEEAFPDNWELPGGHVESGETVKECVERETIEETGLTVDRVVGEFDDLQWMSKSKGRMNVQYNYVVTVTEPMEIRLNPEEHSEYRWIKEVNVDDLLMTPAMNKVLHDSFKFSKSKAVL